VRRAPSWAIDSKMFLISSPFFRVTVEKACPIVSHLVVIRELVDVSHYKSLPRFSFATVFAAD